MGERILLEELEWLEIMFEAQQDLRVPTRLTVATQLWAKPSVHGTFQFLEFSVADRCAASQPLSASGSMCKVVSITCSDAMQTCPIQPNYVQQRRHQAKDHIHSFQPAHQ